MCLSFLLYYPKVALKQCLSSPTYDSISNDQNCVWPLLSAYNRTTQHNRDQFKQKLKESSIFHFCQGDTMVPKALENLTEVKVFAVFQHSHLLGRGIKTRHFRNGSELSPLATDPHYDFDFQETRLLRDEIAIRRGDSFIVECTYDSSGRSAATLGGLSTRDEMCQSYLLYYPKVSLNHCLSRPTYDSISNDPKGVWPLLLSYNWTTQYNRDQFKQKIKESNIFHLCLGDTMVPKILMYDVHENPPADVYVPPESSTCPR